MKKYFILILLFIILFIAFIAWRILSLDNNHIRDTNGENTKLVSISNDDFLSVKYNSTVFLSSYEKSGANTQISNELKDYDSEFIKFSAEKISGIIPLQATKIEKDKTFKIHIETILKSGNLSIAVITPNNEIFKILEANKEETIIIPKSEEGIYQVKLGGESAKCNVYIQRIVE